MHGIHEHEPARQASCTGTVTAAIRYGRCYHMRSHLGCVAITFKPARQAYWPRSIRRACTLACIPGMYIPMTQDHTEYAPGVAR